MNRLLTIILVLMAQTSVAAELTLNAVLDSAKLHTPLIAEANANVRLADAEARAATGVFDLTLLQDNYARLSGFWDGKISNTQVSQRFADFNGRVYAGYRVSTGDFPIYEDILFTNSGGEAKLGVVFSLLQNRDFDQDRFAVLNGRLEKNRAELDAQLTRVQVQFQAMTSYKEWLAAGLSLQAYEDLLTLALNRQSAFEQRVDRGDLATIFLTENRQNILKREVLVNEAQRTFMNAAQKLSFYYRDSQGNPQLARAEQLPFQFPERNEQVLQSIEDDLDRAAFQRPEVQLVDNEMKIAEAELRQGKNLFKPKLDVSLETSRDFGTGSITRQGTDVILAMNFSLPLERTTARGKISAAEAKIDRLAFKRQRINEQLGIEIQSIANDIAAARRYVGITGDEVVQASIMQDAEKRRFANGASDFFVLNLREETTADAQIRNIQAQAAYFIAVAAYYAATVQIDKFNLL